MLVYAKDPCGYYGDFKRECRCSPRQIAEYRQRISGPLLDRIDLHVEVPLVEYRELSSTHQGAARAHDRILKVARTLADLAGSEKISPDDILEAIQFRSLDRKLFS